jgi:hypothetical protein
VLNVGFEMGFSRARRVGRMHIESDIISPPLRGGENFKTTYPYESLEGEEIIQKIWLTGQTGFVTCPLADPIPENNCW